MYDVTSWLGDILSYARLMALMLATTVIASVVNILGALPGSIFALGLSSPCSTLIQILLCGFWYVRCRKQWKDA